MKKLAIALAAVVATAGVAAAQDIASQMIFPPAQTTTTATNDLDYKATSSLKRLFENKKTDSGETAKAKKD